ncbi:hypothetical protein CBS147332_2483 [Penicillium roqueforti]|nr:hypothetical protein CBS147332_2483 [Penicillium roqueforti]KAI3110000.1 hypothetical protein CBS147331_5429 [Penicillium roqueforti]
MQVTDSEKASFTKLQAAMKEALVYNVVFFDYNKQLYAEIDSSKEQGHSAMIFHTNDVWTPEDEGSKKPLPATAVQPIMFLSRLLTKAEQNYWPTELEVACLVWTLQKIRHLLLAAKKLAIVYTDHSATVNIAINTNLRSAATEN